MRHRGSLAGLATMAIALVLVAGAQARPAAFAGAGAVRSSASTGSFAVSLDQPAVTVAAGDTFTVVATVTPSGGFTGTVGFTLSGAPSGGFPTSPPAGFNYAAMWPSVDVTGGAVSAPLTVRLDPSTGSGTYTVYIGASTPDQMVFASTDVTVTPPVARAQAVDYRFKSLDLSPLAGDSVTAGETRTGVRAWRAEIANYDSTPVSAPAIHLPSFDTSWQFGVDGPLDLGPGSDLAQGERMVLDTLDFSKHPARNVPVTTGYDVARSIDTTTIPAGGGGQTVTVTLTPQASSYAGGWAELEIAPDWYGGSASIDAGTISTSTLALGEDGSFVTPDRDGSVKWHVNGLHVGTTYSLTAHVSVPNDTGSDFTFKPMVLVWAGADTPTGDSTGTSTTIYDPELGGTWTFESGATVHWSPRITEIVQTNFEPEQQLLPETVAVSVSNPDGSPAAGAFVEACGSIFGCRSATTDSSGAATISSAVAAGAAASSITVSASSAAGVGYGAVTVAPGDTVPLTVTLQAPQPPPAGVTITNEGTTSDGIPRVALGAPLILSATGCPNGTATYTLARGSTQYDIGGLSESPAGSGAYSGSVSVPSSAGGGPVSVSVTFACPSPSDDSSLSFDIYVDPSGTVVDQTGRPIAGATVTLYRSDSGASGTFSAVPDGSTIMAPDNRRNPDTTNSEGAFGWDVLAGWYYVHVAAPGCTAGDSDVVQVPPPAVGIVVHLTCDDPAALLVDLRSLVHGTGPGKSLEAKVLTAQQDLAAGNRDGACSALAGLIAEAKAQSAKKLTTAQATAIANAATGIRSALGCP